MYQLIVAYRVYARAPARVHVHANGAIRDYHAEEIHMMIEERLCISQSPRSKEWNNQYITV
jgi:hypothetical protein